MINPEKDRYSYGKLLTPPVDYKLEFAVGTTYSLDLNALIGVPISLELSEEIEGSFLENPIAILEGIRRASDKFVIFNEAGQIKVPEKLSSIYSLIEKSVNQVALENKKSFHPKLWIIKYINKENESLYRVIILSRNLTFDRSWDMVVGLEGKANRKRTRKNDGLQDLMTFLLPYCKDNKKKDKMRELIDELYYVHFDPIDQYVIDFDFLSFGVKEKSRQVEDMLDDFNEVIIMSPFITKETVEKIGQRLTGDGKKTLITRKSEIGKLNQKIIDDYEVYALKDLIVLGEEMISEGDEVAWKKQDIHAKLYATSLGTLNSIYVGSANCSYSAFNGNVEFMIKLNYKRRGFRISNLLEDLFGNDEKENPFERISEIPKETVSEEEIKNNLEKAIKQLCRSNINGTVVKKNLDYSIEINVSEIPLGFNFTIAPIMTNEKVSLSNHVEINRLSLEEIGEFFKVTAELEGEKVSRIIKIPIENIPENRDGAIFKNVIGDKNTFFKYVAFILSDNYLLEIIQQMEQKNAWKGKWSSSSDDSIILYENMLRTISKDPSKIQEIEEIIKVINDDKIVPQEFMDLYNTFKEVSRKVKR